MGWSWWNHWETRASIGVGSGARRGPTIAGAAMISTSGGSEDTQAVRGGKKRRGSDEHQGPHLPIYKVDQDCYLHTRKARIDYRSRRKTAVEAG